METLPGQGGSPLSHVDTCLSDARGPGTREGKDLLAEILPSWEPVLSFSASEGFPIRGEVASACV